jgi:hypothetical protein
MVSSFEYGNKSSGSIKGGKLLDKLSDCQLLEKDSTPWGQLNSQWCFCYGGLANSDEEGLFR